MNREILRKYMTEGDNEGRGKKKREELIPGGKEERRICTQKKRKE